jgi:hypothetical protein
MNTPAASLATDTTTAISESFSTSNRKIVRLGPGVGVLAATRVAGGACPSVEAGGSSDRVVIAVHAARAKTAPRSIRRIDALSQRDATS